MPFYQDRPNPRSRRHHDSNQGAWEEEGTRYRDAPRRSRNDKPYQGKGRNKPYGTKGGQRKDNRPPRREDDLHKPRSFDRRPPRPAQEEKPQPSYRDFEHVPSEPIREMRSAPQREPYRDRPEDVTPENLLAGRNPIREALKSGRDIEKLLVQRGELSGSAREIVAMARERHIIVQEVDKSRLDAVAPHHQGMVAFASAYHYATVKDMLDLAEARGQDPFLILLDGVTDPHNLGAVIRTAECVGAHGVIVPERRSVGLTPAAVKASAGAVEHIPVARVTNLNRTMEDLKQHGVWTYAVTMDGEDYMKVDFKGGVALVIGAEGEGISRLTLESCDQRVSLPMMGSLDSLNASVAAGVMMYRVLSQRQP